MKYQTRAWNPYYLTPAHLPGRMHFYRRFVWLSRAKIQALWCKKAAPHCVTTVAHGDIEAALIYG